MTDQEQKLLQRFRGLSSEDRAALASFAEFLHSRGGGASASMTSLEDPRIITRPEEESVVGAMRRLRETYPMLDAAHLLHQAAGLLAEHTLQGRSADAVINELEQLFAAQYQRVKSELENP